MNSNLSMKISENRVLRICVLDACALSKNRQCFSNHLSCSTSSLFFIKRFHKNRYSSAADGLMYKNDASAKERLSSLTRFMWFYACVRPRAQ